MSNIIKPQDVLAAFNAALPEFSGQAVREFQAKVTAAADAETLRLAQVAAEERARSEAERIRAELCAVHAKALPFAKQVVGDLPITDPMTIVAIFEKTMGTFLNNAFISMPPELFKKGAEPYFKTQIVAHSDENGPWFNKNTTNWFSIICTLGLQLNGQPDEKVVLPTMDGRLLRLGDDRTVDLDVERGKMKPSNALVMNSIHPNMPATMLLRLRFNNDGAILPEAVLEYFSANQDDNTRMANNMVAQITWRTPENGGRPYPLIVPTDGAELASYMINWVITKSPHIADAAEIGRQLIACRAPAANGSTPAP